MFYVYHNSYNTVDDAGNVVSEFKKLQFRPLSNPNFDIRHTVRQTFNSIFGIFYRVLILLTRAFDYSVQRFIRKIIIRMIFKKKIKQANHW